MVEAMKKVAIMDVELTVEERNLLSGKMPRRRRRFGLSPSGLIIPRRPTSFCVFVRRPLAVGSPVFDAVLCVHRRPLLISEEPVTTRLRLGSDPGFLLAEGLGFGFGLGLQLGWLFVSARGCSLIFFSVVLNLAYEILN